MKTSVLAFHEDLKVREVIARLRAKATKRAHSYAYVVGPEHRLLGVLNQYHELMVRMVQRNHGTVNKFLGDGVMALYNTPLPRERHALCAVATALEIREALREFHQQFEPAHRMGINFGIHTGQAVVGNVGTAQIMEFTAVGDTVNLAARLQGHASQSRILITNTTYEQVREEMAVRPVGRLRVKNRAETVMTYEVLGRR
jgi:adenylate cyclase